MPQLTIRNRLHYWFDNTMSGITGLFGWLFVASLLLIGLVSLLVVATGIDPEKRGLGAMAWNGLMHTLSTSSISRDQGEWPFLVAMLVLTFGGVILISTTIGVVTTSLKSRLEDLRRGRSVVAEEGHTLILGWSPRVFTILSELAIAHAHLPRHCVAILAEKDKVKMEEEIRAKVGNTGRTRVVCRTGNPIDPADLKIVNPDTARSIIVLASDPKDPDTQVINSILALTHDSHRRKEAFHIAAAIHDPVNLEAARLVGRDEVELLSSDDLIARIAAQTCRESGLSIAFSELLGFDGDEIYFHEEAGLVGRTFGEALLAFEDSALMGIGFRDGRIRLAPPVDTVFREGDRVIAIARDGNAIRLSGLPTVPIEDGAIRRAAPATPAPDRTLILGWNRHALTIIDQLDHYVSPGSLVTVVADTPEAGARLAARQGHWKTLCSTFRQGDTTSRRLLEELDVSSYDHVIVLSYSDALDTQHADARTLITLLHLRTIASRDDYPFSIVSEILDARKRELAEVARADDFIISDRLISLLLLQISENPEVAAVFRDIFDPEGAELHFKRAPDYVAPGEPVTFYTVVESAKRRGEVAVGYRRQADAYDAAKFYGVKLNPPKSEALRFEERDRIIVLAEQ
ncbi:MAG TPA: NAD-binding protein [Armatimonadaceae bacterium]|nr:NAD-binding protein [Armatimonadaceae bacterium]